jgi:geranylgeranyl diphosphate synthase, type II
MMSLFENFKSKIDETLSDLIPAESSSLYKGGRYVLLAPGKRMRPLLSLCVAHMLSPMEWEKALFPACALEMVHAYSLVHDDLPCMDDDDFRRGQPTLHRVYTEGHAVLVGDYLLTSAFDVIAKAPNLSSEQKIACILSLTKAAGGEGMIGGQIMDIENSLENEEMHARKTAALFCAAVEFGALSVHASVAISDKLQQFALQFGKLFQMVDDLLDGDHFHEKTKAETDALHLFKSCMNTLDSLDANPSFLMSLTNTVYSQIN